MFVEIDYDKHKDMANKYGVSSFPTILAVSATGTLLKTFEGDRNSPRELELFVDKCLGAL